MYLICSPPLENWKFCNSQIQQNGSKQPPTKGIMVIQKINWEFYVRGMSVASIRMSIQIVF